MREVIIITDPKTVKVLSEPTRFQILKLLRERPMSVNELSELLEKDRTTVYRHIKALESEGLVEEVDSHGHERIYTRTARMFLIKVGQDESIAEFRQSYLQVEAGRLVEILEKSGFTIHDRDALRALIKDVLDLIELRSQPILKRISEAGVELNEVELFHLLNMLVFIQSCELCEHAKRAMELVSL